MTILSGAFITMPPPARALSVVLSELVDVATKILDRPHSAIVQIETVERLTDEIVAALRRPHERARTIDERALFLCKALAKIATTRQADGRDEWRDLAEYLLPGAKRTLAQSLAADAEPLDRN